MSFYNGYSVEQTSKPEVGTPRDTANPSERSEQWNKSVRMNLRGAGSAVAQVPERFGSRIEESFNSLALTPGPSDAVIWRSNSAEVPQQTRRQDRTENFVGRRKRFCLPQRHRMIVAFCIKMCRRGWTQLMESSHPWASMMDITLDDFMLAQ